MKKKLLIILVTIAFIAIAITGVIHIDNRNYRKVKEYEPTKEELIELIEIEMMERGDTSMIAYIKYENIIYARVYSNGYVYNVNFYVMKTDLSLNYHWQVKRVHLAK